MVFKDLKVKLLFQGHLGVPSWDLSSLGEHNYEQINDFETFGTEGLVLILIFFMNFSAEILKSFSKVLIANLKLKILNQKMALK